jgi:microsomal dipeptidase-like Zn-dependent dipeptidase
LYVARDLNPVLPAGRLPTTGPGTSAARDAAGRLHDALTVVDLHSDALLWDRDLLHRGRIGHADLPRWIEGRVAVQAFTVVTHAPRGINVESNAGGTDLITALSVLQLWPPRTWGSKLRRALHQADKLRRFAAGSRGRLAVVTTREELAAFLRARAPGEATVAGFLGLEGAHALEGDPANVDVLFEAGFRMIGLVHFVDNEVGGSAHGVDQGGLSEMGGQVLDRMDELGMVVDLSHASTALLDDVLAREGDRPRVVSHTGVQGTCPGPRNLSDDHLRAVARTGGVIGIGLWPEAVCGEDPAAWARAVRYAVELVGVGHVSLGSDWDGAVPAIVDASGTRLLTAALIEQGFTADDVRAIMGGNALRVLLESLPSDRTRNPPMERP